MACTCGHSKEEHGHDPEYPGSTACQAEFERGEACDCIAFESDGSKEDGSDDSENG
jgi:hypothetical protein